MTRPRLLPFDEALQLVLSQATAGPGERVELTRADGRVLAEDVAARTDVPFADVSTMDGYALRAADCAGAGHAMLVRGEARAGGPHRTLEDGTAARIFTGAPLPTGADTVIPQEDAERDGDRVGFSTAPTPGSFVRLRGEELTAGAVALTAGTRLGPAQLGLLAAVECAYPVVHRAPTVAIVGCGDELRALGEAAEPGRIVDSNGFTLAALARRAGAIAHLLPILPDRPEAIVALLEAWLDRVDVLITVGGMSVGDHDHTRGAFAEAGVESRFWGVAMKPGKPVGLGVTKRTVVLGLPGNPGSAFVTFQLFAMPLLRTLQGDRAPVPDALRLRVRGGLKRKPGRREFARARTAVSGGELVAQLLKAQASGASAALAEADCLVVVPEDLAEVHDGDRLDVILLAST